ncbi:MAG: endonuclease [Candidatus Omnitrophica bacterium CG11_big_fil_rev_8_21_14_0_20_64_10]|nr:MAG: endonuclease [Candidatus Omnitrophica bacterium CG11_big_fil_rev_8_21_14_0_20_64_10]
MVRCADGALYSGVTTDLDRRLREHNAGRGSACTRARRPVRLVYRKRCVGRGSALRQEAGLKRLSRRKKEGLLRTSWAG